MGMRSGDDQRRERGSTEVPSGEPGGSGLDPRQDLQARPVVLSSRATEKRGFVSWRIHTPEGHEEFLPRPRQTETGGKGEALAQRVKELLMGPTPTSPWSVQ
jgi:hypothetical protein